MKLASNILILLIFGWLLSGCSSSDNLTLHTKDKVVTVKVRKNNGWTSSGVSTKKIQFSGGWAILTTSDGRTLVYPSESVIDIVIPKG